MNFYTIQSNIDLKIYIDEEHEREIKNLITGFIGNLEKYKTENDIIIESRYYKREEYNRELESRKIIALQKKNSTSSKRPTNKNRIKSTNVRLLSTLD